MAKKAGHLSESAAKARSEEHLAKLLMAAIVSLQQVAAALVCDDDLDLDKRTEEVLEVGLEIGVAALWVGRRVGYEDAPDEKELKRWRSVRNIHRGGTAAKAPNYEFQRVLESVRECAGLIQEQSGYDEPELDGVATLVHRLVHRYGEAFAFRATTTAKLTSMFGEYENTRTTSATAIASTLVWWASRNALKKSAPWYFRFPIEGWTSRKDLVKRFGNVANGYYLKKK